MYSGFYDEKNFLNFSAKYSFWYIYGVLAFGFSASDSLYTQGIGMGIPIKISKSFSLDTDFLISNTAKEDFFNGNGCLFQIRSQLNTEINESLQVFTGFTLNFYTDDNNTIDNPIIKADKAKRLGFVVGVSFLF